MFVAIAAFTPAYIGTRGNIRVGSLIEMALGVAIGAITFTGSLVAFAKLQGLVSGKPLVFNGQHMLNAGLGVVLLLAIVWLCVSNSTVALWIIVRWRWPWLPADPADRRRRHAGRGVDAEQLFRLGGSRHRLHAGKQPADHHRRAGRVFGAILSYIMRKGMNRSIFNVILGGFGGDLAAAAAGADGDRAGRRVGGGRAAFIMKNASSVIIVPGYGMAVA